MTRPCEVSARGRPLHATFGVQNRARTHFSMRPRPHHLTIQQVNCFFSSLHALQAVQLLHGHVSVSCTFNRFCSRVICVTSHVPVDFQSSVQNWRYHGRRSFTPFELWSVEVSSIFSGETHRLSITILCPLKSAASDLLLQLCINLYCPGVVQ